jgi:hypothetical protein
MNGGLDYASVAAIVFIVYVSSYIYGKFQRKWVSCHLESGSPGYYLAYCS